MYQIPAKCLGKHCGRAGPRRPTLTPLGLWIALCAVSLHAQVAPCGAGLQVGPLSPGASTYDTLAYLSASNASINTDGSGHPTGSSYITFQAGTSICLAPGFQAAANGSNTGFQAKIAPYPWLTINSTSLPSGVSNMPYSAVQLTASGGLGAVSWSASPSALPPGISLSSAGVVSGTPTTANSYSFTVSAADSGFPQQIVTVPLTLAVNAPVTISQSSILNAMPSGGTLGTITVTTSPSNAVWVSSPSPNWQGWVSTSPTEGTGPQTVTVTAQPYSGTATRSQTFVFSNTVSGTVNFVVSQLAPLAISSTSLAGGVRGVAYSQSLATTGGLGPYTWAVTSGSLPQGLVLASNGLLSGSPSATGDPSFTVTVTDQSPTQQTATATLSINVQNPYSVSPTSFSSVTGTSGTVGTVSINAASPAVSWAVSGPPWLTSSPTSGTGSGSFTVTAAANNTGAVRNGTIVISGEGYSTNVTVTQAVGVPPLAILTQTLPTAFNFVTYCAPLVATGGSGTYAWSLTSGALPTNMTMVGNYYDSPCSGEQIFGSSGELGVYGQINTYPITLTVTDTSSPPNTAQVSLTLITEDPVSINPVSVTLPYEAVSNFSGFSVTTANQGITWGCEDAIQSGTTVFTLYQSNGQAPANIEGNNSITISAGTNESSSAITLYPSCYTNIGSFFEPAAITQENGFQQLELLTGSPLPTAFFGVPYNVTLSAQGGTPPLAWSVLSGSVSNISLSPGGVLTGTAVSGAPSAAFHVQVKDSSSPPVTATATLTLPTSAPFTVTSNVQSVPSNGGPAGSITVGAPPVNGWSVQSLAWSLQTAAPSWLTVSPSSSAGFSGTGGIGTITLTAAPNTSSSSRSFNVVIWNGSYSAQTITVTQAGAGALTIVTQTLSPGQFGTPYGGLQLSASGGNPPYAWSASSGSLPASVTLSSAGVLSGTPSAAGTFTVQVTATDSSNSTASTSFSFVISAPITVSPTMFSAIAPSGGSLTMGVTALQATTPWSAGFQGSCSWLTLSPASPQQGNGTVTATAGTNSSGATRNCVVQIASTISGDTYTVSTNATQTSTGSLTITTTSPLSAATVNVNYSQTLSAQGGAGGYTWTASPASLPPGLTLTSAGVLSGTPTASSTGYSFGVTVSDASQNTATGSFSMAVNPYILVAPTTFTNLSAGGVTESISVTAPSGVAWTVSTLPAWITASASSGTGSASLTITIAANSSSAQSATMIISAGGVPYASVSVSQAASPNGSTLSLTREYIHEGSRVVAVENQ